MTVGPIIGITTQTLDARDDLPRCWIMSQRYVNAVVEAGGVPWVIPLLADGRTLEAIYARLDGVLLPGGVDIDPETYGSPRHPLCGRTDPDRDRTELMLARWALRDRKPLLGICRGVQLLNVAAGGTLYQDIGTERDGAIKHDYFPEGGRNPRDQLVHEVTVDPRSRLADLLQAEHTMVNSMHHQGIRTVAPTLVPVAHAPDGVVEGVESPDGDFVFGVQWHPEDLTEKDWRMRELFERFVRASREARAAGRERTVGR